MRILLCFFVLFLLAAEPFELRDGDRVVLIGNTLIEREQRSGYWETLLTRRWPDRNATFRNLGWSGDTVWGHAQAGFGSTADGFKHLKEHVLALKPTVIVLGYGANEAFDGEGGLVRFREGTQTLLDTLAPTKARLVILSPTRQEDLGRPLPDPTAHNRDLGQYAGALREIAGKRGAAFVDLLTLLPDGTKSDPPAPLTDNGIHLTTFGYWKAGLALEKGLGSAPPRWQIELSADRRVVSAVGARVEAVKDPVDGFRITDALLPVPLLREASAEAARILKVRGLPDGRHTLLIDGEPVARGSAAEWAEGIALTRGPELDQVERLREAIVAKNQLYFHRWRPQNETYLFGFRKHEQGQNAREIPQFDPLIEKQEQEIAKLRVPVPHIYELKPERKR
jgi:lysophospholipase L1-like esterase